MTATVERVFAPSRFLSSFSDCMLLDRFLWPLILHSVHGTVIELELDRLLDGHRYIKRRRRGGSMKNTLHILYPSHININININITSCANMISQVASDILWTVSIYHTSLVTSRWTLERSGGSANGFFVRDRLHAEYRSLTIA